MPAAGPEPGAARGIVQINHGLAEHSGRYRRFAAFLASRGYHVYAHDHRGHGQTSAPDAIGHMFASRDGIAKTIADVAAVHAHIAANHPGLPVIIFGHSLGGMVALNYAEAHPERISGLAVWNSNFNGGVTGRLAQGILAAETMFLGSDVESRILPALTFRAWGKAIENHRTLFDWLSRDSVEVDAYIADPLCGWDASVSLWKDIFKMMYAGAERLDRLPKSLPVHLVGGAGDPATFKGKALIWLGEKMRRAGLKDVSLTILPETRHESLNEIGREETCEAFVRWANRVSAVKAA